jgi:hypothetical protein
MSHPKHLNQRQSPRRRTAALRRVLALSGGRFAFSREHADRAMLEKRAG